MPNPVYISTSATSWATAASWDTLLVPVTGDNVYLQNNGVSILDGLNQAAVTLASLHQAMTFTGAIGLAKSTPMAVTSITRASSTATLTTTAPHGLTTGNSVTVSGAVETEYNGTFTITVTGASVFTYTVTGTPATPATGTIIVRLDEYLRAGVTLGYFGEPSKSTTAGAGSGRVKLNFGTIQHTGYVYGTAARSTDTGEEPLKLTGTHASNKLYIVGTTACRVGWGTEPGVASVLSLLSVAGSNSSVIVGASCTLTTVRQVAGAITINCAVATIVQESGVIQTDGVGAISTAAYIAGTFIGNSTGTITLLEIQGNGHADLLQSKAARIVTLVKMYKDSKLSYDPAVVTISGPIQLIGCTLEDVTIVTPDGITVAVVKT